VIGIDVNFVAVRFYYEVASR